MTSIQLITRDTTVKKEARGVSIIEPGGGGTGPVRLEIGATHTTATSTATGLSPCPCSRSDQKPSHADAARVYA
ncbi:hypothetical protein MTO96_047248 [Rhipicephalus appendiculatus]